MKWGRESCRDEVAEDAQAGHGCFKVRVGHKHIDPRCVRAEDSSVSIICTWVRVEAQELSQLVQGQHTDTRGDSPKPCSNVETDRRRNQEKRQRGNSQAKGRGCVGPWKQEKLSGGRFAVAERLSKRRTERLVRMLVCP